MKSEIFIDEINYIKNNRLQDAAKYLIENLPDYFFEVAATSSGKYHPAYALGQGGLVRHTKAALALLFTYLDHPLNSEKFTDDEKDLMIIGLMLHDGVKSGNEKAEHTVFDHPLLSAQYVKSNQENAGLNDEEVDLIMKVISSHMGPWNKSKYEQTTELPIPESKYELLVHFCDYFASRKFIEIKFDENDRILLK